MKKKKAIKIDTPAEMPVIIEEIPVMDLVFESLNRSDIIYLENVPYQFNNHKLFITNCSDKLKAHLLSFKHIKVV